MATTSPALAEYEKHAEKFGSAMVMETASMNGFTTLAHLQLRLFEIESQQPKRRRRRGRR